VQPHGDGTASRSGYVPVDPLLSTTYDEILDMTESVALEVRLQAFVRRDSVRRWVAICPMVGVVSQGMSDDDARRCIQEAVELWFESCVERGVLDQALREANFRPSQIRHSSSAPTSRGSSTRSAPAKQTNVLGEPFEIHLTIPAYEAATRLSATA
jgi:predicted RNase H-like HicB family nuclease